MQYIAKSACKKDWKQKEKRSKQTLHFRGGFRVQNKLVTIFCKIDSIYITVIAPLFVVIIVMFIVVVIIIIVNVAILFCFEILVVTA